MLTDSIVQQLQPIGNQNIILTQYLPVENYVSHVIQKGDTFKSLAQAYYNDPDYWTSLWNDNPQIADPNNLPEGYMIRVRFTKSKKPDRLITVLQKKLNAITLVQEQASIVQIPSPQVIAQNYPQSSFDDVYKAAGARFGIPWQILYGIHMTETGGRNGPIFSHYGTGAEGPMQFMPGTFNAYAINAHGSGIPDINNAVDAIYTAANFLAKHGNLMAGLEAYGGNTPGILELARARGFND
jgi:soluble lytic murein transglycosylase-like protein